MAEPNWGLITSGETFEALVRTLVFFEDSRAALFGRRGKDGGQDVRSGDGTLVYQAKYHANRSWAEALRDAKREAEKISEYRTPGHARFEQWQQVTRWKLVTNAEYSDADKRAWGTQVEPLFAAMGLAAEYWSGADLSVRLAEHPEVRRAFFGNETRVFLTVPEIMAQLPEREPFLRDRKSGRFCGRAVELKKFRAFLASDKFFLLVHGAGGIGKTRFLVEAGDVIASEGEWQVLWANVESMRATASWFDAVVPERKTLLLVDEPGDEGLLKQLVEQLGLRLGRAASWKVAVAVRSSRDPLLRFLRGAKRQGRVEELPLDALPQPDAEEMCLELLRSGPVRDRPEEELRAMSGVLAERFSRIPVWMTLAVQRFEGGGAREPTASDAGALADEYLLEVEEGAPEAERNAVRALLRWVALLGTVNREEAAPIRLLASGSGVNSEVDVREKLETLVRRRALMARGVRRRFVELKPDVFRDRVLLRWLSREVGGPQVVAPSDEAVALGALVLDALKEGRLSSEGRAILESLARVEVLLRWSGHALGLLDEFFAALEAAIPAMKASQRVALAPVLESLSGSHPAAIVSIVRCLRGGNAVTEIVEGLFGERTIGQDEVLLALAWPLYAAAMGADEAAVCGDVFRELCQMAEAEAELALRLPRGLPNDGKRAAGLIRQTINGGPLFASDYAAPAAKLCLELIQRLERQAPTTGDVVLRKSLLESVLDFERQESWMDGRSFTWRTHPVDEESAEGRARRAVLERLQDALSAGKAPRASRTELWRAYASIRGPGALERLTWMRGVLTTTAPELDELSAARPAWDWHRRFEKVEALKRIAEELEAIYTGDALAREFKPLLELDEYKGLEARVRAKADLLAGAREPVEIAGFVERAKLFLCQEKELYRLGGVAWSLGTLAESRAVVRQFITASLGDSAATPSTDFAIRATESWLLAVRRAKPEAAHPLVVKLLSLCGSDERRTRLLASLYRGGPRPEQGGEPTPAEHALLRGTRELFEREGREPALVAALARSVNHEWATLRPLLEDVLRTTPPERIERALVALVDGVFWAVRQEAAWAPPADLGEWLLTQLLDLPDLEDLDGNTDWQLKELSKSLPGPDVAWLSGALRRRQKCEVEAGRRTQARAIGHHVRLSKFVRKIESEDVANPRTRAAVSELLAFIDDKGSIFYYLPRILTDIDPHGLVVPDAVADRVKVGVSADDLARLARVGSAYPVNEAAWRRIALATIRSSSPFGAEALRLVHGALDERGVVTHWASLGEVPAEFSAAVAQAHAFLDAEAEPDLRPYWERRLKLAEAELRHEEEHAKEERGE